MHEILVVDASAGLRAALPGQPGHEDAARCLMAALKAGWETVAPDLYLYEVGNAIARTRGKPAAKGQALLDAHSIVTFRQPGVDALQRAMELASEGGSSYYDAAYVALAEELDAPLWTEDREILKRYPARATDTAGLLGRFP